MQRRDFLKNLTASGLLAASAQFMPQLAWAAAPDYRRLLILVELKGANDGLNTVIPFAAPEYAQLRPRIGLKRGEVLQLDERTGLHPALQPLLALWQQRELAIVQSVGYPTPNLSHFRSIEIWDTASNSNQYLSDGWLTRVFSATPPPSAFAADGVVIASNDLGPLAGAGARAIALSDTEQFARQAKQAHTLGRSNNPALQHLLKVETDVAYAASRLAAENPAGKVILKTDFPKGAFGNAVKTACEIVASGNHVAVMRLTLTGFDTHQNQAGTHANLLKQLAEGLVALKSGLSELGRWQDSLVMTYAEFGRRPKENQSNGTDHGTAAPHFVLGGRVRGGLYGEAPKLSQLDGNGNLPFAVDYRSLYATALERWWDLPSSAALGGRYPTLDLLKA